MVSVELIHGDGNRKKYRKGENKQRHIKIRENKNNNKKKNKKNNNNNTSNKRKTEQVISVIKIGICALILNGELYRVSLEILLHDFCSFGIFYTVSSKAMSKQLATIVEVIFLKGFWEPIFGRITNAEFVTNFSFYFISSFDRFVFYWLKSVVGGSKL